MKCRVAWRDRGRADQRRSGPAPAGRGACCASGRTRRARSGRASPPAARPAPGRPPRRRRGATPSPRRSRYSGGGPAAAERMGEGHLGLAQHHAEAGQVEGAEERARPPATGGRPSRRRGGTPGASAPRCASRRRRSARPRTPRRACPARASVSAAARPLGPEPTTTASTCSTDRRYRRRYRACSRLARARCRSLGCSIGCTTEDAGRRRGSPRMGAHMAEVHGTCDPRFDAVRATLADQLDDGRRPRRVRRGLPRTASRSSTSGAAGPTPRRPGPGSATPSPTSGRPPRP